MKLEEILENWKNDCKIDNTDLANESLKSASLHAKYYEMYTRENLLLKKTEHEYRQLLKTKTEYYRGRLSDTELNEYGWPQFEFKLVNKDDWETYLNADKDLINILLRVSLQEEKVNTLQDIIRAIHSRPYIIKNAIEFLKFSSGF